MWTHIATAWCDGGRLDLYERNGAHMIRADGWELMNGVCHASEDRLGRLAGLLAREPDPEILLGGLGLGYTLASLMETLSNADRSQANIMVAERSGTVLFWFATYVNPRLVATLPSGVRLIESDVLAHLGANRRWDVIVLDVDNGPVPLSASGNAVLYTAQGLSRCRDSLAPRGHLLLWSGFEDPDFVERARLAGFSVTRQFVAIPNRADQAHVLYVLSQEPLSAVDRDRTGLNA
jgi:spermidine synthase